MRLLLTVELVLSLVGSGFAASSPPVRYTLTFRAPEQVIGMDGVIRILRVTGVIGGVEVIGEYTDTAWRVGPQMAPEHTLADGKLSCAKAQCIFSFTTLLDEPVSIPGPAFAAGLPVSGPLPGFATRQAWASAVSRWAESNIDPGLKDKIVSQAAGAQSGSGQ
jgi:hypothetical protein